MDKKNTMLLTVVAVATLLVAVVGATFAFFSVTGTNKETTTNVTTTAEKVGTVTLTDSKNDFYLNLTAAQMASVNQGKSYWATTTDVDALANEPDAVVAATISSADGDGDVKYECSFAWELTVSGEEKALAVLKNDSVVTLTTDAGIYGVAGTYNLGEAQTGKTGKVQFEGNKTANINALIEFKNTTVGQNDLAGASTTAALNITAFSCDTVAEFSAVQ